MMVEAENTLSKIAKGKANVAQALGTSTIPEILPSTGAQDKSKYICSSRHGEPSQCH